MKLAAVKAELHIIDGQANWAAPIRIAFEFENASTIRLRGAGDGQRLIIDRLSLEEPVDMGDYGRIDIFDFTDRLGLESGEAIGEPISIRFPSGEPIGVALPRAGKESCCIWINGDEFHWGSEAELKADYWPDGFEPALEPSP